MGTLWRIQLLGGLRAEQDGRVVARFRTQKAASLLAYLAYYRQRSHPRELLIELLWPECEVDVARHRLSVALSLLRQQLEPVGASGGAVFVADHFSIGLDPEAVTTDVAEFEAALKRAGEDRPAAERARCLAEAVDLYRGELLPGYYEEWIPAEQQRWEELFFRAVRQLIACCEEAGEVDRALQAALRAVSIDPLREEAQRDLMRLYAATGQPSAALRQYHDLQRLLKQELGEPPSDATRALADTIKAGVQVFRSSGVQADPAAAPPRHATAPIAPEHLNTRTPEYPLTPSPLHPFTPSAALEPIGGAVPLDSPYYVVRDRDAEFRAAIERRDSFVLLKGASGVGKTSLLARGLQQARQAGARVVLTDLQKLNAAHLESAEALCQRLAEWIADQLDLDVLPDEVWHPRRGPSANLERYLRREVLGKVEAPIVWGLDEVDRLFEYPFGSEIFRLFRSWHNERALDPSGPWSRLTLAICYATEVHLFITDLNQSPFNIGERLLLEDFTPEQVADLNRRYGAPLKSEAEVTRFYQLVSGHPHLVRLGLHEMASHGTRLAALETQATGDGSVFGDHLQRLRILLARDPDLCEAVRELLQGRPCPTPESFYRLRSAGLIVGDSAHDARLRCQLYTQYLARYLL
jgi:DNA-binding SARP family transcriptional activator